MVGTARPAKRVFAGRSALAVRPPGGVESHDFAVDHDVAGGAPVSVYEVHPGSWWRKADGSSPDWDLLGDRLIPYVRGMGFTHLELLPVNLDVVAPLGLSLAAGAAVGAVP